MTKMINLQILSIKTDKISILSQHKLLGDSSKTHDFSESHWYVRKRQHVLKTLQKNFSNNGGGQGPFGDFHLFWKSGASLMSYELRSYFLLCFLFSTERSEGITMIFFDEKGWI